MSPATTTTSSSEAIASSSSGDYSGLVINEIDYDQPGEDSGEFVEIRNNGAQTLNLAPVRLVFADADGVADDLGLYDHSLAPGQLLVAGTASLLAKVTGAAEKVELPVPADEIVNTGPAAVSLFTVHGATATLLDAVSYGGSVTSVEYLGSMFKLVEGNATLVVDGEAAAGSLVRLPDGKDSNDNKTDWSLSKNPTPGAPNKP